MSCELRVARWFYPKHATQNILSFPVCAFHPVGQKFCIFKGYSRHKTMSQIEDPVLILSFRIRCMEARAFSISGWLAYTAGEDQHFLVRPILRIDQFSGLTVRGVCQSMLKKSHSFRGNFCNSSTQSFGEEDKRNAFFANCRSNFLN